MANSTQAMTDTFITKAPPRNRRETDRRAKSLQKDLQTPERQRQWSLINKPQGITHSRPKTSLNSPLAKMSRHPTLSILQHTTMKPRDKVMASLLRDKRIINYDLLAIQEPWRNPFMDTIHNPIPQHFELAYHNHRKARACFFINKRIGGNQWSVTHNTPDLSTLELRWEKKDEAIVIHNVYNPVPTIEPTNNALPTLREAMGRWKQAKQVVVGDFNLHHPYGGGLKPQRTDPEAEEVLRLVEEYDLALLYEPGMITFRAQDSETTIDLSLATSQL